MIEINQEDIKNAERLLLPKGEVFSDERKEIITSLETKDIKACPGSGKTTTLLAKLAIISNKLPLNNNNGVCVLTHTNVALNEIKTKLGVNGAKLFSYPNNCSTIQSFINQYLAIPAYIDIYGRRPVTIDDDFYNETIKKKYHEMLPYKLRKGIEYKNTNMIYQMRFNLESNNLTNGIYGNLLYKNKTSETYQHLHRLKVEMLNIGVLCFDDAYALAYHYLDKYPEIKEVLSKRFFGVFIDEMQDTMRHQNDLLNNLFNDSVIVQRIGDQNQAIYDHQEGKEAWKIIEPSLSISDSKRFSPVIANTVKNICVSPQSLTGNPKLPDITPTLIVFTRDTIKEVIPYFGKLILENKLEKEEKPVFKAIGWVTKEHEKYDTLLDYWNDFEKNMKQKKNFSHLSSYLNPETLKDSSNYGAQVYRQSIIQGILKALRIMGEQDKNRKFFTTNSFLEFLKAEDAQIYEKFSLKLTEWCLAIQNNYNIYKEVTEFIEKDLQYIFKWTKPSILSDFLELDNVKHEAQTSTSPNTFKLSDSEVDIKITLDSIHGVKGETHTATLYLETYFYDYDIHRIINYLKGEHKKTNKQRIKQNLKMAYVGFTRPSHMLCVAVHEETIKNHEEDLKKAGWKVEYVQS
ncbi:UvrD-helicase domain-containing protein [Marinococcus halophilus]|uniref:UvrD-helicase domain-containing protein n=1 Tax=Marinococcus halophilus TaxID=1371 RepID=UPI0009A67FBA|nr:UvrD-helicase domain-containing protein [Marinococcus halophilus]